MQRQNYIRLGLIVVSLAALFILLRSSSRIESKVPCKKSMGECCKEKGGHEAPGNMIFENLSRQFFSFTSASY
jgi:hypothetical protein